MRIKELPVNIRPREKASLYGVDSLTDHELLMLILRHGNKQSTVHDIAHQVLIRSDGLSALGFMSQEDFMMIPGIKQAKALELMAVLELSKRMGRASTKNLSVMENSKGIVNWLQHEIGYEKQECFLVILLNVAQHIIAHEIIFKGTLDRSLVHPREIFNLAVKHHAASFIAVHNHPAGTLIASDMDIIVTQSLQEAGKMMGIPLIDHLIVTKSGYLSILHQFNQFQMEDS